MRGHQAYGDGLQVNGTPEVLAIGVSIAANNTAATVTIAQSLTFTVNSTAFELDMDPSLGALSDETAAVGLTVGGAPAVIVAAWVVRSLPLGAIRWLVVGAVLIAAWTMLRASMRVES